MSNWVQAVPQDYFGGTMISSLGYKKARVKACFTIEVFAAFEFN
jgi:hypothetical protein